MRISDWSSDVCSSDLRSCVSVGRYWPGRRSIGRPCRSPPDGQHRTEKSAARGVMANSRWCHDRSLGQKCSPPRLDHLVRKSVGEGKRVPVRVDLGGRRNIKKQKKNITKRVEL